MRVLVLTAFIVIMVVVNVLAGLLWIFAKAGGRSLSYRSAYYRAGAISFIGLALYLLYILVRNLIVDPSGTLAAVGVFGLCALIAVGLLVGRSLLSALLRRLADSQDHSRPF